MYVWLVSTINRADAMLAEQEENDWRARRPRNRHRNRKRWHPYVNDINYFTGLQHACGGYFKAMLGLKLAGKINLPMPDFDKEEFRFCHRSVVVA